MQPSFLDTFFHDPQFLVKLYCIHSVHIIPINIWLNISSIYLIDLLRS